MTDQLVTQVQSEADVSEWADELEATATNMKGHAQHLNSTGRPELGRLVFNAALATSAAAVTLRDELAKVSAPQQVGE